VRTQRNFLCSIFSKTVLGRLTLTNTVLLFWRALGLSRVSYDVARSTRAFMIAADDVPNRTRAGRSILSTSVAIRTLSDTVFPVGYPTLLIPVFSVVRAVDRPVAGRQHGRRAGRLWRAHVCFQYTRLLHGPTRPTSRTTRTRHQYDIEADVFCSRICRHESFGVQRRVNVLVHATRPLLTF